MSYYIFDITSSLETLCIHVYTTLFRPFHDEDTTESIKLELANLHFIHEFILDEDS